MMIAREKKQAEKQCGVSRRPVTAETEAETEARRAKTGARFPPPPNQRRPAFACGYGRARQGYVGQEATVSQGGHAIGRRDRLRGASAVALRAMA